MICTNITKHINKQQKHNMYVNRIKVWSLTCRIRMLICMGPWAWILRRPPSIPQGPPRLHQPPPKLLKVYTRGLQQLRKLASARVADSAR